MGTSLVACGAPTRRHWGEVGVGGGREGRMRAAVEEGSAGDGLGVGEARCFSGHGRCA